MSNAQTFYKLSVDEKKLYELPMDLKRPEMVHILNSDTAQPDCQVSLRYFKGPTSYPLDLNIGYENYKFRDENSFKGKLSMLEQYLMRHDVEGDGVDLTKVCAQRSVLNRLMALPYQLERHPCNDFCISATKFKGILFLYNSTSSAPYIKNRNDTYHFKFEQYCYAESPEKDPKTDIPVDENDQIFAVFRTMLNNFNIYYSAEIDGIISDEKIENTSDLDVLNDCRFVVVKLVPDYLGSRWKTSPHVLRWWIQSHLANVHEIYVGSKSKSGIIHAKIDHIFVDDLPKHQPWKPNVCIGFLNKMLSKMNEEMGDLDCPYTVYQYQYDSNVELKQITAKVHLGKTQFSFLTESFVNFMQNKNK